MFSLGSSVVGCGGVVRDLEGNVLEAFMYSVYRFSSVEARLLLRVKASMRFWISTSFYDVVFGSGGARAWRI